MSPRTYDVVIVGSGFAGLSAADLLGGHGLRVLILDENYHLGGQMLRTMSSQPPHSEKHEPPRLNRLGFGLRDAIRRKGVHVMHRSRVLGIYPERVLCIEDGQGPMGEVRTDYIVLATGAREKFLPFPGWTLPGVIAAGGAQILMKSSGILPARETLIGGSGPLLLVLADAILNHGGRVQAVLHEPSFRKQLRCLVRAWRQMPKVFEGGYGLAKLLLSRIPVKGSTRIVAARGPAGLEEVITVRLDRRGQTVPGTEARFRAECLAVGYGFTPNLELPQLAGCAMEHHAERGGWIVRVDDHQETSVPNVYAAGEITGIAGARKSFLEGQLAALDILRRCGMLTDRHFFKKWPVLHRGRRNELEFGKVLNALWQIPLASYAAIPDETVICRCEDVTMGAIRTQLRNGFATPGALKKATRCGMGYCQGRICGPSLNDILAGCNSKPPSDLPPLSVRVPVKAVRLGVLAGGAG